MSNVITAGTLQAINRELHRGRFTEDDVAGLVGTGHGVISSLDSIFADLGCICMRDLGLIAPDGLPALEQEP